MYRLFSSKLGILKALLDTSIAGDDQPLAVPERPTSRRCFAEADPHKLLAGFAGVTTAINQRTNDVYRVLVERGRLRSPQPPSCSREIDSSATDGQGQIARSLLARARALKPGLRQRDAADLIHALMSPEVYRLLVGRPGLDSPSATREWLPAHSCNN